RGPRCMPSHSPEGAGRGADVPCHGGKAHHGTGRHQSCEAGRPAAQAAPAPHLFRHTYATRLHELDVDLLVIQGLLGHESVATTEIYTRVSAARQAIQALEGRLSS